MTTSDDGSVLVYTSLEKASYSVLLSHPFESASY